MSTALHWHWETRSRDCDGGHGYDGISFEFDGESGRLGYFRYISFTIEWMWIHPGHTYTSWRDDDGTMHFSHGGWEDEGSSWEEVYTCTDERCDPNYKGKVYDQYAQLSGY